MAMNKLTFSFTDEQVAQLWELKKHLGASSTADVVRRLVTDSWEKKIHNKYKMGSASAVGAPAESKEQERSPEECCKLMLGKVQGGFCLWYSGKASHSGGELDERYVSATSRKTTLKDMIMWYKAYHDKSGDFAVDENTSPLEIFSKDEIRKRVKVIDLGDRVHD